VWDGLHEKKARQQQQCRSQACVSSTVPVTVSTRGRPPCRHERPRGSPLPCCDGHTVQCVEPRGTYTGCSRSCPGQVPSTVLLSRSAASRGPCRRELHSPHCTLRQLGLTSQTSMQVGPKHGLRVGVQGGPHTLRNRQQQQQQQQQHAVSVVCSGCWFKQWLCLAAAVGAHLVPQQIDVGLVTDTRCGVGGADHCQHHTQLARQTVCTYIIYLTQRLSVRQQQCSLCHCPLMFRSSLSSSCISGNWELPGCMVVVGCGGWVIGVERKHMVILWS
jgi:hypothetical protein